MLQAGPPAALEGVQQAIGGAGKLLVVEPRRTLALKVAERGNVEVVSVAPSGTERFGAFDALVAAPMNVPRWSIDATLRLAGSNLRPGGRFVIDLPGHPMSEDLAEAYERADRDTAEIEPWIGPTREDFEASLARTGLRDTKVVEHHHVVRFESPLLLARLACEHAPAAQPYCDDLTLRLVERMRTTGAADYVIRRIAALGMR